MRTGGQVLADQLKIHDVDTAFCVPGESYLALIDALHDASNEIKVISCRQEAGILLGRGRRGQDRGSGPGPTGQFGNRGGLAHL